MSYEAGIRVEERLASLFQPDALLEAQYYDTFRRKAHLEPERSLMLAVLEDAVACFQNYLLARDGKGKALFREAEEWIMDRNSDWLFSFENTCEVSGINPECVRQGLLRWKEKKLTSHTKMKIDRLTSKAEAKKPGLMVPDGAGQMKDQTI